MIYICHRQGSGSWAKFEAEEFKTEQEAIKWLQTKPRKSIVGIFNGKRLQLQMGEKRVVAKTVIGFEEVEREEK